MSCTFHILFLLSITLPGMAQSVSDTTSLPSDKDSLNAPPSGTTLAQPASRLIPVEKRNEILALQYNRWAEVLTAAKGSYGIANTTGVTYLEKAEQLLGRSTPRIQFHRAAISTYTYRRLLSSLHPQPPTNQPIDTASIGLMQIDTYIDYTRRELKTYFQLAAPTDSRYSQAQQLQQYLTDTRTTLSAFKEKVTQWNAEIETLRYYAKRYTKAKKGRGILLATGIPITALGLLSIINGFSYASSSNKYYNSASVSSYYGSSYGPYNYNPSGDITIGIAGMGLVTTAILKYVRVGKYNRKYTELSAKLDERRKTITIKPTFDIQFDYTGTGLKVIF